MEIAIPAVPLGVLTLLAFFGPYAVGALNGVLAFVKKPWQRKAVSVAVALVLAVAVIVVYLGMGGELPPGGWAVLAVWSVVVVAASYAYVTKTTASRVESAVEESKLG